MIISAVLAVSTNDILGAENSLPWRISNDLRWFKKNTLGKPMIMGRKTYESLPGILPKRPHIILTRDTDYKVDGAIIAHTAQEALEIATETASKIGADEIAVVGGGEIYRLFLPHIQRFYLTRVHTLIEGDTAFFPLSDKEWRTDFSEFHEKSEKDEYDHTFLILNRI